MIFAEIDELRMILGLIAFPILIALNGFFGGLFAPPIPRCAFSHGDQRELGGDENPF